MTVVSERSGPVPPVIELMGRRIHAIDESECVRRIAEALGHGRGGWVVTPNLDHLRRLVSDASFARVCDGATLTVADGRPLVWASKLRGTPLPGVVAGSNLVNSLSAALARDARRAFYLGGDPGTAEATARRLSALHPGLVTAGIECPAVGFERDEAVFAKLRATLIEARPDVVWVALGSPKQEHVIERLRDALPRAWWLGIGISFSFVSGDVKRAPRWMQRTGLEWVHRLAQEPRRPARRYLVEGLPFAARLLTRSAVERFRRRGGDQT